MRRYSKWKPRSVWMIPKITLQLISIIGNAPNVRKATQLWKSTESTRKIKETKSAELGMNYTVSKLEKRKTRTTDCTYVGGLTTENGNEISLKRYVSPCFVAALKFTWLTFITQGLREDWPWAEYKNVRWLNQPPGENEENRDLALLNLIEDVDPEDKLYHGVGEEIETFDSNLVILAHIPVPSKRKLKEEK